MLPPIVLSFLALALGPLLVLLARRAAWSTIAVDSFCVITICGFSLLHLLPECIEQAGWLVVPLALAGFLAPTLAERGLHRRGQNLRRVVLALALLGMAAHDTLDGIFLHGGAEHAGHAHAHGHEHDGEVTAWAIILHRIPEGIGIWWIVPRTLGMRATVLVTVVTVAATLFGYSIAHTLDGVPTSGLALLQALLAGSLLHVVLHAHIPAPRDRDRWHFASVAGAIAAVCVLWFVIHDHFPGSEHGSVGDVLLAMASESAPALLLAYGLVGLCHAYLPSGWLRQLTRGSPLTQALRGVAIGLPLPVCSCGVLPIYRQLVAQGASLSAAIAFLVATPELELTAVLLTWSLLGGKVALVRVAMAAVLALAVGMIVGALGRSSANPAQDAPGTLPTAVAGGFGARLREALRFGYGPAVDNTATWIVMGLLLSAMLVPYVDRAWIAALPKGIDVPIAALIGLPLYVCATGSTPLAAVLLAQGLSPGAALALLLTGPATNLTTFGVLGRLHGKRTAIAFAAAMWLGTIALGYLANLLLAGHIAPPIAGHEHEHGAQPTVWLWLLGGLFALSLLRQGVRPFLERLFESPANHDHSGAHADHSCCAHEDHQHPTTATAATGPGAVPSQGFVALPGVRAHADGKAPPPHDHDCCGGAH